MGNKFGNFATFDEAQDALIADGFKRAPASAHYNKKSVTGGNLMEVPRSIGAFVEISSYRVDGKYATDGRDYHVFQHHFI